MNLSLLAFLGLALAEESVRGVPSIKQSIYQPDSNGKWKCLNNPEIEIDFSKVNDDYCDCPDGSDEPGTSACSNGRFYCENKGYKPSYIPSFKVNDGVCDYDVCCDGSDEWNTDVSCENKCEAIAKEQNELINLKKEKLIKGLEIKNHLINKINTFDEELNNKISKESLEVSELNNQVYSLKKQVEELNTIFNSEAMELISKIKNEFNANEIETKIYELKEHVDLIKLGVDRNNEKTIKSKEILLDLSQDFDQNLNDVAVKEAIKKFEEYENEPKYKEFDDLYSAYLEKYNKLHEDLDLFNVFFLLPKNREHLINWKNFILTRKTKLHDSLLKLLIIQDESSKVLEKIMEDIKNNYDVNFNNEVVKNAIKEIDNYEILKNDIQENVLGKIDYANKYDGAAKELITLVDTVETKLGFGVQPTKDLQITDEYTEDELNAKFEAKKIEIEELKNKTTELPPLNKLKNQLVFIVNDFLGVYDNVPEAKDPFFDYVPYDLVSKHLDEINDLSTSGDEGNDEYSSKLKSLNEEISTKQVLILELNNEVAALMDELNDSKHYFGPNKILKAIEGEIYKAPIGEYEYEINFLGDIHQVGNGHNSLIGRYNGEISEISNKNGKNLEMSFKNGAKCWSGPIRQAKVSIYCGNKVEVLKVTEPEVCHYLIDITSPIACFEEDLKELEEVEVEQEKVEDFKVEEEYVEEEKVEAEKVEEEKVEEEKVDEKKVEEKVHDEL